MNFSYSNRQEVSDEICERVIPDIGDWDEQSEAKGGDGDEKDKRKYGPKDGRNGRENTHVGGRVRG